MDIALAIERLLPAAKYSGSVTANTKASYTKLVWNDSRAKPTWTKIQETWTVLEAEPKPKTKAEVVAILASSVTPDSKIETLAEFLGLK